MSVDLLSCIVIIERDAFGECCVSWSYPLSDDITEKILISRSNVESSSELTTFIFSKHKSKWHYLYSVATNNQVATPDVDRITVAVTSNSFNPESFNALLKIFSEAYVITGNPLVVLEKYLSVVATGQIVGPPGKPGWALNDFDPKLALVNGGSLVTLASKIGPEQMALLWNAMLLKKRVAVFCDAIPNLLSVCRVLPQLVWHRRDWSILRPYVVFGGGPESEGVVEAAELTDLTEAGVYCAGFTHPGVRGREDLFDVLLDVPARSVVVSERARADFFMTSLHKDVGRIFGGAVEGSAPDQALIKALKDKTGELLAHLRAMCGDAGTVSLATLQGTKMPRGVDRFLYSVALAEGVAE